MITMDFDPRDTTDQLRWSALREALAKVGVACLVRTQRATQGWVTRSILIPRSDLTIEIHDTWSPPRPPDQFDGDIERTDSLGCRWTGWRVLVRKPDEPTRRRSTTLSVDTVVATVVEILVKRRNRRLSDTHTEPGPWYDTPGDESSTCAPDSRQA